MNKLNLKLQEKGKLICELARQIWDLTLKCKLFEIQMNNNNFIQCSNIKSICTLIRSIATYHMTKSVLYYSTLHTTSGPEAKLWGSYLVNSSVVPLPWSVLFCRAQTGELNGDTMETTATHSLIIWRCHWFLPFLLESHIVFCLFSSPICGQGKLTCPLLYNNFTPVAKENAGFNHLLSLSILTTHFQVWDMNTRRVCRASEYKI